jgi:hypothetical protein
MQTSATPQSPPQYPKPSKAKSRKQPKLTENVSQSSDPDKRLFQRLGCDMVDRLAQNAQPTYQSLNLVGRLSPAKPTAIFSNTTTTTVKEQIAVETVLLSRKSSGVSSCSEQSRTIPPKYKKNGMIFTLDDFNAIAALELLAERFGRVSHMGILDKSYSFFVTKARDAALYFKVKNKIAVVGGDPLCHPGQLPTVLAEFKEYRKRFGWGIAVLGAPDDLNQYAKSQKCVTMNFGTELVLNPLTNPVLHEKAGKRIVTQNKQLLDPKRGGIILDVYIPSQGKKLQLQEQLVDIYNDWREYRNKSGAPQAYMTVYDPFALPDLMTYIYTTDRDGTPNGFAALRKLGANSSYHIDPCIAAPGAPRGISDLLIFSAMALLNKAGISYLSFVFEPLRELAEITGMPKPIARITRSAYRRSFQGLPIGGKKEYHDKFRLDEEQQSNLHLVFPAGVGLRHAAALMHIANISVGRLVTRDLGKSAKRAEEDKARGGDSSSPPAVNGSTCPT